MNPIPRSVKLPLAAAAALLAAQCAVNPATGRPQVSLYSESQEVELGREASRDALQQYGEYSDADLEAYVARVGKKLAAQSERPDLPWTFKVVDDPVVNAFALPGGYIFVTRGILAHLDSEAELAAVLGHEIGHVTARHGVNQMSKAQLLGGGLGVIGAILPESSGLVQAAETGLGLLFLKYGRDDERQADALGFRYMTRAGYDPRPMADVFEVLRRVSEASGGGRIPTWMATHPAPEDRRQKAQERIASFQGSLEGRIVDRPEYLREIDGIVYGDDPRQGYFEGDRYYHPALRFSIAFPEGWAKSNQRSAVLAGSPDKDARIQVTLSDASDPSAAQTKFFSDDAIVGGEVWRSEFNGLAGASRAFTIRGEQSTIDGVAAFVANGGRVFQLAGFALGDKWAERKPAVLESLASFRRVDDPKHLDVSPERVALVTLDRAMTVEEAAKRYGAAVPAATLALLNQVDAGARLDSGRLLKIVK